MDELDEKTVRAVLPVLLREIERLKEQVSALQDTKSGDAEAQHEDTDSSADPTSSISSSTTTEHRVSIQLPTPLPSNSEEPLSLGAAQSLDKATQKVRVLSNFQSSHYEEDEEDGALMRFFEASQVDGFLDFESFKECVLVKMQVGLGPSLMHSYSYTHSYTHTLIRSYTHALMHSCTHTLIHAYTHTCMHSCTHTLIHACTHALMHSYTIQVNLSDTEVERVFQHVVATGASGHRDPQLPRYRSLCVHDCCAVL
jgi:hypothetical protein